MTVKYNKLVRDNIPEIIIEDGNTPNTIILEKDDMVCHLLTKLSEEFHELLEAANEAKVTRNYNDMILELCDVSTVIDALVPYISDYTTFDKMKTYKNETRGEFFKRIFLIDVEKGVY